MQKSTIAIFSPAMASELIELGYEHVSTEPNRNNPKYKVYIFKNTAGIGSHIKRISCKIKQGD